MTSRRAVQVWKFNAGERRHRRRAAAVSGERGRRASGYLLIYRRVHGGQPAGRRLDDAVPADVRAHVVARPLPRRRPTASSHHLGPAYGPHMKWNTTWCATTRPGDSPRRRSDDGIRVVGDGGSDDQRWCDSGRLRHVQRLVHDALRGGGGDGRRAGAPPPPPPPPPPPLRAPSPITTVFTASGARAGATSARPVERLSTSPRSYDDDRGRLDVARTTRIIWRHEIAVR